MLSEENVTIYIIQITHFTKEVCTQLNTLMAPKALRYLSQSADKKNKKKRKQELIITKSI
jgi:hypothetical protein